MRDISGCQAWLDAGYDVFAVEGRSGIQVERLARILGVNKSAFYHFFGDRQTYFEKLVSHHLQLGHQFVAATNSISKFVPDYIGLLTQYAQFTLVNIQLARDDRDKLFSDTYAVVREGIENSVLPVWSNFIGLKENTEVSKKLFVLFNDMLYSRLSKNNLNPEFLSETSLHTRAVIQQLLLRSNYPGNERFMQSATNRSTR